MNTPASEQRIIREFFTQNEAGKKLLARWENRVASMRKQLSQELDVAVIRQLQGGIQIYEKTILPEDVLGRD